MAQSLKIHHEGTKDTKDTKNNPLLFSFVCFVSFVPSWLIFCSTTHFAMRPS